MAYIKGYQYDIFISYSHLDNLKKFDEARGWVEEFYTNLNILLSQRIGKIDTVKIWWDSNKLDGDILYNQSIAESISTSAIMLCLISPGYLASTYCQKELQLFYDKAEKEPVGLNIGNRNRIVNVLLNNIRHDKWPPQLSGTTGFKFHDAENHEAYGNTLDFKGLSFKNQLMDLKEAIAKLLDEFKEREEEPPPPPPPFTIYFGDVADSLRTIRNRTLTELKKQPFQLISDVPPPYEAIEHESTVKEKLKEASLAVHLLDQYPGRNIDGTETIWYPQKQAELSLQCSKQQLIWVPADINIESIEEEPYKVFLRGLESGNLSSKNVKYIRGPKSELTQQIIDLVKNIEGQWAQPQKGKISVLLDTNYDDQLYALELSKGLLENEIQPFINPQEDDPRKNINILEDRISQVSKLIFFYGKATRDWVKERMNAALQLIVSKKYPTKDFFIFMMPPHKDTDDISLDQQLIKVNVVNNSDTLQLDFNALVPFFNSIKATS